MISQILEKNLNSSQREAVQEISRPLLVLSGAGTGKTRVITYKMAYLMAEKKIRPEKILAMTFTNKAAGEMKTRAYDLLDSWGMESASKDRRLWMGTFHSNCGRMLRYHAKHLGFTSSFTIVDEDDKLKILKSLIEEKSFRHLSKIGRVKEEISRAKNSFLDPEDLLMGGKESHPKYYEELSELFKAYLAYLLKNNSMDFDDLIVNMVKLLYQDSAVKDFWQSAFDHILVDEFQDTNKSQYLLLKMLMRPEGRNLTLVGDDDQSIYSFRGATIANILSLSQDFPELKIVRVEENYRSRPEILSVANHLISKNQNRLGKTLKSSRDFTGELPEVFTAADDREEARRIAEKISEYSKAHPQWSFGIIYRMNSQSRVFENALRTFNLPYRILGAKGFYDRREIKDIIAYLRIIANPQDDLAFERIINVPARGIGETTLDKIRAYSRQKNLSLFQSMEEIAETNPELKIRGKILESMKEFTLILQELREMTESKPEKILSLLMESIDFIRHLDSYGDEEDRKRNVEELERYYDSYFYEEENADFHGFLQNLSLMDPVEGEEEPDEMPGKVSLSTVHACKGLEFDTVFVSGMAEGVFPHHMSIYSEEDLEEERRLCYVAATRAKEILSFSYPQKMFKNGTYEFYYQSRFIGELDPDQVKIEKREGISELKDLKGFF